MENNYIGVQIEMLDMIALYGVASWLDSIKLTMQK